MDLFTIEIGVAAFLGGIVMALLGWTESGLPFDVKKFMSSVIRALVAGVGIAVVFDYGANTGPLSYFIAFLAGAGVDVGGNRVAGAIAARIRKKNGSS